jgi:N-acetylneuraminate 9-O-acetyltransferase
MQRSYGAAVRNLTGSASASEPAKQGESFRDGEVELEYIWDPYLNSSKVFWYAQAYRHREKDVPMLMVVGGGQRNADIEDPEGFVAAVERIADAAPSANGRINSGSATYTRDEGPGDMLLFTPVLQEQPWLENGDVVVYRRMNELLDKRAQELGIDVLWSFADMTANLGRENSPDSDSLESTKIDILVGLRCNAKAANRAFFPNTRTCCASWRAPNWIQSLFLFLGLVVFPLLVLLDYRRPFLGVEEGRKVLRASCAFTATVCLQYLSDRTRVFEQVRRLPLELPNLYAMLGVAGAVGLVAIRRTESVKKQPATGLGGKAQNSIPILPRDQTDEFKGWMQLLIITYHYNKAWGGAYWFWQIIRLSVSSYLFLTGFGHTVYTLQKKHLPFARFVAVLMRTNLLPVALAYVLRTRWLLYYYMPLSTFWFRLCMPPW